MAAFSNLAFDVNAFSTSAFDMGAPTGWTGVAFSGGFAVDNTGILGTVYLEDIEPVPAGNGWVNGFAVSSAGMLYVCLVPGGGIPTRHRGIARRSDGAMCIILSGSAAAYSAGWGLTALGEVLATTATPDTIVAGVGVKTNGYVCMSEIT